jgi:hypothetical protein
MNTGRKLRWLMIAPAALVTTVGLIGAARPAKTAVPVCQLARTWAIEHKGALPKTEAELERFSSPYRKAIYTAMTVPERTALWHEHLRSYLNNPTDFSAEQIQLIREFDSKLGIYMDETSGKAAVEGDQVEARAKALFGKVLAGEIFATIGRATHQTAPHPEDSNAAGHALGDDKTSEDGARAWCGCSQESDYCWYFCAGDNPYCDPQPIGCGTGGWYHCNGSCY